MKPHTIRQSSKHAFVTGRVQGVFYRGSLEAEALRLNLCGFVRNLADGRVEYYVIGGEEAVETLYRWSLKGPRMASVTNVDVNQENRVNETFDDFSIRY